MPSIELVKPPGWIPYCLRLEPRQIAKAILWHSRIPKITMEEHDEMFGGFCIDSGITVSLRVSSIDTEIKLHCHWNKNVKDCDLTIDDDGELEPLPS